MKWTGFLGLLAIAVLLWPVAQLNGQNLEVMREVAQSPEDVFGRLVLRDPASLASPVWQETGQGCAALWQSRLWASYDAVRAEQFLADMAACDRLPENQLIWQGNLAWLGGDPTEAVYFWEQLPDTTMLLYARTALLSEEQEVGLRLIEILSRRASKKPASAINGPFFADLADLYRYAGQELAGLSYHMLAWQSGQQGYEQAYYLGRSLAQSGQCTEAVEVFVSGYSQKPDLFRPQLDFSYYVTWGACHATLGQTIQAQAHYDQARAVVMEAAKTELNSEVVQQQLTWLNHLEQQLPK